MALVSPGIQISINDQSQYVNSNAGSVPLVILATAENKSYNGSLASGTLAANAGKLLSFTSQRDLVTRMGTPTFEVSAAGTPVNGSEINEYGLLAAYSALGLSNQLYAIRADIDLNQLIGTSVRPLGAPSDGTYWLDTVNTDWGLNLYNATTATFSSITPLIITSSSQVQNVTESAYGVTVSAPKTTIGSIGQFALVFVNPDGTTPSIVRLFYKAGASPSNASLINTWVEVGSSDWQKTLPAVVGTTTNPSIQASSTLTINTVTVTTSGTTTVAAMAVSINTASIPGVTAGVNSLGQLEFFVTSAATSTGGSADGKLVLTDGTHTPLAAAGVLTTSSYYAPYLFYGNYAQEPSGTWSIRPSGSVWWKTSATGGGLNIVMSEYSASAAAFQTVSVPAYAGVNYAINGLDPSGGGINIAAGAAYVDYSTTNTANGLQFFVNNANDISSGTGGTPGTFTAGNQFTIKSTAPGQIAFNSTTITLSSTTATSFVSDILAANIPYVTAALTSSGTITITHTTSGAISMSNVVGQGTPLTTAGFAGSSGTGYSIDLNGNVVINNFTLETASIQYLASRPYSAPADGTYWYYSNPADVDIMINDGTGWKGYRNVTSDFRGYDLSKTDTSGVIVSASQPVSQLSGSALASGDLWLNTSDLVDFPALYRYNKNTKVWTLIDKTDQVTSNGILFADARWDSSGTTDIISGSFPSVSSLLTSNYIDQDAPDYRLYPRGMLLFNTRRSGYNVKKYVHNYFNSTTFPNLPTVPGAASSLPTVTAAWVTASGLNEDGSMAAGSKAQRAMVVAAMEAAINSNLDVLSLNYQFNLICAPNYPELISSMLTLNDNRGDTAFVIGDTPMTLEPSSTAISDYLSTNALNASPYLALYYPAGLTSDLLGNTVVVPASHAALRTFLYNDQVSHPWFAPAGVNRGLISNLSDIGYINQSTGEFIHNSVNQGLRDALATLNVNPLTQLPNVGLVIFGQLTRLGATTARNRINVVRLENYLRTIFQTVANGYLFEPNDAITRKSIATQIEGALNNVLALRGLYDYLVVCDTNNNTPSTIANNQLYVDVAIEPMRDVEFIYIPIAIYNPGSIKSLGASST
jgi:Phage tail sheath C-terminal domain